MLVSTGAAHYLGAVSDSWPLYAVIIALAGANAVFSLANRRGREVPGGATGQIVIDLLALTALLHFAGGVGNPLVVLYVVHAILGAMLLPRRRSYWMAALGCVLFKMMALAELFGILAHHPLRLVRTAPGLSTTLARDPTYVLALAGICIVMISTAVYFVSSVMESLHEREAEVRTAYRHLQAAIDSMEDTIVLFDAEGREVADNTRRRNHRETRARWPFPDHSAVEICRALRVGPGVVWTEERQSDERTLRHRFFPVEETAGRSGGMVWVIEDVTEQRRLESLTQHRDRMASAGLLAAGVAHEIRNPLASISAVVEDLGASTEDAKIAKDLRMVSSHVFRIDRILSELLGFAKPPSRERTASNMSDVVTDALGIVRFDRRWRGRRLEECPANGLPDVETSRDELVQVFVNLTLNALDAMQEGDTLKVSTRSRGDWVLVEFLDSGCGMPEEVCAHVFDPFFTTKTEGEGAGLGLSVSDSIVRAHGGYIDVSSEPGEGTRFTVHIPVCAAAAPSADSELRVPSGAESVLVDGM